MDGRRSGMVLVAIGLIVAVVGVFGFVTDRGTASTVTVASPGPSATLVAVVPSQAGGEATPTAATGPLPTASPAPAATPSPTASPTPTPNLDARVRAFYAILAPAIRSGDVETLASLLHTASIERYGAAGCRASFAQIADPAYAVVVKTVHPPAPWDYARDGRSTTIADTIAVDVDVTTGAGTSAAVFHITEVDGAFRWFADCGTPLGSSPSP